MKTVLIALGGETRKGLLINWTYRINALMTVLQLGFIFLAISFFMGQGQLEPEALAGMLVGYVTWYYTIMALSDLCWGLRSEMQAGTLEQLSMSAVPTAVVLLGRTLANFLWATPQVVLLGLALRLGLGVVVPLNLSGLFVLAITLMGVYGFGYVVGGATLLFRQIESLVNLLQNAFLFLNGSMMPIALFPAGLAAAARALPSTQGIIVLRQVLLEGQTLAGAWADGSLTALLAQSLFYLALGWLAFTLCERRAKQQGSLGQY